MFSCTNIANIALSSLAFPLPCLHHCKRTSLQIPGHFPSHQNQWVPTSLSMNLNSIMIIITIFDHFIKFIYQWHHHIYHWTSLNSYGVLRGRPHLWFRDHLLRDARCAGYEAFPVQLQQLHPTVGSCSWLQMPRHGVDGLGSCCATATEQNPKDFPPELKRHLAMSCLSLTNDPFLKISGRLEDGGKHD